MKYIYLVQISGVEDRAYSNLPNAIQHAHFMTPGGIPTDKEISDEVKETGSFCISDTWGILKIEKLVVR